MIVYSTGYLKDRDDALRGMPSKTRKTDAFKAMVERLDAIVVDIRFTPWSRAACWRRENLRELVGPDRYVYIHALGNKNYRGGGEIEIVDLAAGIAQVLALPKDPILLCGCDWWKECHRSVVRDALEPHVRAAFEIHQWRVTPEEVAAELAKQQGSGERD